MNAQHRILFLLNSANFTEFIAYQRHIMKKLLSITIALLTAGGVSAADLTTIYQEAVANDTEIAAARATRDADGYDLMIARSALLPQASVSYNITRYDTTSDTIGAGSGGALTIGEMDKEYTLKGLQVQASQTLFNLNSWYNYKAASTGDESAELELHLAKQQLLLRTADAYFNVLRAQDNLAAARAEEKAVKRSLEQTKQRYEVGLIAITDVHEAQAAYDLSYAYLLGQEAALDISYEMLEQLTGQRYDDLALLKDEVAMEQPENDVQQWVDSGLEKYVGVLLAEAGKDAVLMQRNAARSNHAPTATLFASYSDAEQAPFGASTDPMNSEAKVIGVEFSMPLLTGGANYGRTKQAAQKFAAIELQAEKQRRDVKRNVRSLYRQVQTDSLNVRARKQSMLSAESALEATETGYRVGTRNIVEVLNAQKNLYGAQRDYANARYDYIINLLNLKFYAGTLNEGDLALLNEWLKPEA